ncbi:CHD5-like protein-domain-containing protein [Hysterangium stoloniferum]|nr:CHD5-like protein-domain-containing protein [Hysterangium stoloniferum]
MSLGLTIFLLALLAQVVTWIGSTVLLNLFYAIHQYIFHASTVKQHRQLKKEILSTKQELLHTSAQDQFAKWAKLRRKVDKALEDLEKLNNAMAASKSSYTLTFNSLLWIITSGAQYALGWWYGKHAVFYLPPQWFGPAQWCLALPFAPLGSVSVGIWQMACRRVLRIGEDIIKDFMDSSSAALTDGGKSAGTSDTDKKK